MNGFSISRISQRDHLDFIGVMVEESDLLDVVHYITPSFVTQVMSDDGRQRGSLRLVQIVL